jgi:hypothetical protein
VHSPGHASTRDDGTPEGLYRFALDTVLACLDSACAWVFIREDSSGDFVSAAFAPPEARPHAGLPPLRLKKDAFALRRLARLLHTTLSIDPGDLEAWERGLEKSFPEGLASRREEIETLRIARTRLLVPISPRGDFRLLLAIGPRRGGADYTASDREYASDFARQLAARIEEETRWR